MTGGASCVLSDSDCDSTGRAGYCCTADNGATQGGGGDDWRVDYRVDLEESRSIACQ